MILRDKKTFLDHELKLKNHVPDAKYDVRTNMNDKTHRSNWCRNERLLIAIDVQNFAKRESRPAPSSYKP